MNIMKKNGKNDCYDNTGEHKTLEEIARKASKKLTLNLRHQALHSKMA